MATIKSFTDLSQSKTLSKILPLESADMKYISFRHKDDTIEWIPQLGTSSKYDIPCWSLSALLSVLSKIGSEEPMIQKLYYASNPTERYICQYSLTDMTSEYDNPVDACVVMIESLHKSNLL